MSEEYEPKIYSQYVAELIIAKTKKNLQIDQRSLQLISAGFTFDSESFSLSTNAQINWSNIKSNKLDFFTAGLFPMGISTKDDGEYTLEYVDVDNFYMAGAGVVKSHYDSGRALKLQVNSATTVEEVDAVEDNR